MIIKEKISHFIDSVIYWFACANKLRYVFMYASIFGFVGSVYMAVWQPENVYKWIITAVISFVLGMISTEAFVEE